MCVGIPAQVIEADEFFALCKTRNGEERINTMLIGQQEPGTWLMTFLGQAREIITEEDAINIDKALDGLSAIMSGETNIDVDHYFPDMGRS